MFEETTFNGRILKSEYTDSAEEVIQHGLLLIIKKGGYYSFYLPKKSKENKISDEMICIFKKIEEYIYHKGLLLVKRQGYLATYWTMVVPKMLLDYLDSGVLNSRLEFAPTIHCKNKNNSKVKFLKQFDYLNDAAIMQIDNKLYFVGIHISNQLVAIELDGTIEETKIFNTLKVINQSEEKFLNLGRSAEICFGPFAKIEKFTPNEYPYIDEHFQGYWGKNANNEIVGLIIGKDETEYGFLKNTLYSYKTSFQTPVKEMKL